MSEWDDVHENTLAIRRMLDARYAMQKRVERWVWGILTLAVVCAVVGVLL